MRCDQCQFWEKPDPETGCVIDQKMGRCAQIPHREDMTEWDGDMNWVILQKYADRTAAACDASGYSAHVITTADHFCAMFKEKTHADT